MALFQELNVEMGELQRAGGGGVGGHRDMR